MADTTIEWTDKVFNPTTGCDQISPGCDNCYALKMAKRLKGMGQEKYQTDGDPRTSGPGFGLALHPSTIDLPRSWKTGRRIFVNSMSDLFHAKVPLSFQQDVFKMMAETPQHTYQVLTKRALHVQRRADRLIWSPNVWMGVSVENRDYIGRIDHLREVPAKVRFISAEPLLGPLGTVDLSEIHWLISGGESGPKSRPIDADWVRSLRDQCQDQGVAFFHKQWGGIRPKANGRELDGVTHDGYPETVTA